MPSSTGTLVFNDQKIQAPDIYATESLGVGVSDPTSNLQVVGNAYVSSNLEVGTANLFVDTTTGRVGVGTGSPQAVLDVQGDTFSNMYNGGRSTFLTWDYLGSRSTSFAAPSSTSGGTVESILDHEFDVPACYHDLGTATLKAYVKIDWRGEAQKSWNFIFRIKVYYNDYSSTYTLDSSAPDQSADNRGRGCGIPCVSYYDDNFDSTPEAASITSLFTLPNCQVSSGSKIKVELLGVNTVVNSAVTVYTGRCKNASSALSLEMLISSFFVALDVV